MVYEDAVQYQRYEWRLPLDQTAMKRVDKKLEESPKLL